MMFFGKKRVTGVSIPLGEFPSLERTFTTAPTRAKSEGRVASGGEVSRGFLSFVLGDGQKKR